MTSRDLSHDTDAPGSIATGVVVRSRGGVSMQAQDLIEDVPPAGDPDAVVSKANVVGSHCQLCGHLCVEREGAA